LILGLLDDAVSVA